MRSIIATLFLATTALASTSATDDFISCAVRFPDSSPPMHGDGSIHNRVYLMILDCGHEQYWRLQAHRLHLFELDGLSLR